MREAVSVGERELIGHTKIVRAVATAQLDNRPVIISGGGFFGGNHNTLRTWDLTARAST